MTIFVEYQVPVLVEIDERERRVVSVRVDDESVAGPFGVMDIDSSQVPARRRARAVAVADETSWPGWTLGV